MARPQVLIDGVAFENHNQIGVWRVFFEVISRLKSRVDFVLLLERAAVNGIPRGIQAIHSSHRCKGHHRTRALTQWRRQLASRRLEKIFPDAIWHSSYFTQDPRSRGRSIVHIYDMIAERFHFYSDELENQCSLKFDAVSRADCAICISTTTAGELVRFFPAMKGRVFTAPLGAEHIPCPEHREARRTTTCLYVGHRSSYKNFQLIVRSLALPQWPAAMTLTVVGSSFTASELAYLKYQDVESKVNHLGRLTDTELSQQYSRSHCYICPSLDEGFGLPVLESQAHGCLPVLSDIPVFREVSGGAAAFFHPHDPKSLAEEVAFTMSSQYGISRSSCIQNSKRYSWEETAEITYNCYLQLANSIAK